MRYDCRLHFISSLIALAFVSAFLGCIAANAVWASQIQKLPEKRQQRVFSLLDQIQNAYADGETSALNLCNAAIAEFPQIGEFYLRRGNTYKSAGNHRKALADYRHARLCDPELVHSAAQFSSAIYCQQKKFDLALKELDSLPASPFGFRGEPETRVAILLQMGNRTEAESIFRKYRNLLIARGTWSDVIRSRFPAFAGLALEEPKPNTTHSAAASEMLKELSAFETMPTKAQIEPLLGIKLVAGKSPTGDKSGLAGNSEFFKVFIDERNKQFYFALESGVAYIAAKNLLKELNYTGSVSDEGFYYTIRKTPSDPKMITLDFSGDFKGLSSATFSWNVAPDSPRDALLGGFHAEDSPLLLAVLKELDAEPKPIDKAHFEAITKCKLKRSENIYPAHFYGMTETEMVWRSGNGFSSKKSWSVNYTPNGASLNDSRLSVAPGVEKVTRIGLDTLFGPGVELQPSATEWRVDSDKTFSYKRPYGSITAVFPKHEGNEKVASSLLYWWKGKSPYATLEELETNRTALVLWKEAVQATSKNEFRNAAHLLRLAYMRGGLSQQSGQEKYELWKKIRTAYVDLYQKKGESARADYLRNVSCEKMNSDLMEIESGSSDFPTLKEAANIPWRIIHPPDGVDYRLQGEKTGIEIYRSSPNFRRCVELFGPMNDGADLFVKSIPADLFDSEYFGPGYYD